MNTEAFYLAYLAAAVSAKPAPVVVICPDGAEGTVTGIAKVPETGHIAILVDWKSNAKPDAS